MFKRRYRFMEGEPGAAGADWRQSLPEEMRADPALANFETPDQMAKSFIDMKAYQGSSIRVPGEDASQEAREEFVAKLMEHSPNLVQKPDSENPESINNFWKMAGRPDEVAGYEIPESITSLEGDAKPSEERMTALAGIAHEANLTKDQFKTVMEKVTELDTLATTAQAEAHAEAWKGLEKEWGSTMDERVNTAMAIAKATKAPEFMQEAIQKKEVSPEFVKWMFALSESFKGEGVNMDMGGQTDGKMTPIEAKEKIAEIMANREHPYWKADPDALKRMVELQGYANPTASRDINDLRRQINIVQ